MIRLHLLLPDDHKEVARLRDLLSREGFQIENESIAGNGEIRVRPAQPAEPEDNGAASEIEELELALRELRNLDVAKSQFLANVSHELRTPLTAIVTYAEVLRDGLLGQLNDRQREAVQSMIGSSRQLLGMIEEILTYARTGARAMELQRSNFSVGGVIEAVHEMSASLIRKKGIRFESEVAADVPEAHADRDKVLHVLSNLVGNAIEFTPAERGLIRVTACRSERDPRWIEVSVVDNGIGIDPAHHEMIFREFAQVDSSRARKHHGTGLGLAIARNFIVMHGGEIGVESDLGRGSRFYFTIPSIEVSRGPSR